MYYYLVDPRQFEGKNFEFFQTQLLSLLGEYHVSGEVARVTKLRTIKDLVATALSHGATTLVVVGGDETYNEVISFCHGKTVSVGYIPIQTSSELGRILGIGGLVDAVAVIAKRRLEEVDVARVGSTHFISNLQLGFSSKPPAEGEDEEDLDLSWKGWWRVPAMEAEMRFDNSFQAKGLFVGGTIINLRSNHCPKVAGKVLGNPKDGYLDITLATKLSKFQSWRHRKQLQSRCFESLPGGSVIHAKKIEIKSPQRLPLLLSGRVAAYAPATVEMTEEKVQVVVGKSRQF